jgi:hypothetical protein
MAMLCRGLEKNGMVGDGMGTALQGNGMGAACYV